MDNDKIQELLVSLQISFAEIKATLDSIKEELAENKTTKTEVAVMKNEIEQNKKDIKELKDSNTWLWRTIAAAIIVSVVALFFKFIKP